MVVEMLAAFEAALAPGIRERELLAVLSDTMLRAGGEYLATSTVCSGPNTNPWRSEATDRVIEPGDHVFVDTDTVGIEGYFFCVSRSFLAGEEPPTPAQRDTYEASLDWLEGMKASSGPASRARRSRSSRRSSPRSTCRSVTSAWSTVGFEEESPSVCYPIDRQSNGDRVIREDMALVIELYAGEVGGDHGVKLGDEVHVTADGVRVLAPYPFGPRFA